MKKSILVFLMGLFFVSGVKAQVSVAEPEFAEQTLLLTSDSKGTLLTRENGTVKTKAGASLYLTGIGKVKSRLTVAGTTSKSTVQGGRTTRLIVKAKDNATDPQSFISIFKFEVKGTLSKTESNNLSSVDYNAKRYGKNSYYLVLNDLEPGEYGIVIGDPNTENTKNGMKVTTFTVK